VLRDIKSCSHVSWYTYTNSFSSTLFYSASFVPPTPLPSKTLAYMYLNARNHRPEAVFFNTVNFYRTSLRNYALMLRIYDQQVTWINFMQM